MSGSLGAMMLFVYYLVDAKSLRHVWVLTFNPCGLLLSLCLLIHTTMIHTAARLWGWCVIHTHWSTRCAPSHLLCNILTFWLLLCGQISYSLLIGWYQSVTAVFTGTNTHTHTSAHSSCHKLVLRFLVPPRKWNRKADEDKQWPFILTEKTAIVFLNHTRCTIKDAQRSKHLFDQKISPSTSDRELYLQLWFSTQLLCVCVISKRPKLVEISHH